MPQAIVVGSVQRWVQSDVQPAAGFLRILGEAGAAAAGSHGCDTERSVSASLAIYPLLGLAFFPQTDAGQFTINLKVPTGTRIEVTEQYVAKVEDLIRQVRSALKDLKMDRFQPGRGA